VTGNRRGEGLTVVAKLAGFALGVVAAFAVGLGVGAAVGPLTTDSPPTRHDTTVSSTVAPEHGAHSVSGLSGG
jgi:hypothetical protein